ncbi:zinc finger protein 346 [Neosynchiropus ocellatus]
MADAMPSDDFPYLPAGAAEVNKMIKEHGDLFSDTKCTVCSAILVAESQKLTHYQSRKHANRVRRYFLQQKEKEPQVKKLNLSSSVDGLNNNGDADPMKFCEVCNMSLTSPVVAQSHYLGKVHAKNLKIRALGPKALLEVQVPVFREKKAPCLSDSSAHDSSNGNRGNPNHFCAICSVSFNNPLVARQHYHGKKHRKHMTKVKLMETYGPSPAAASAVQGYSCSLCNIELNSVEQYQSHVSGSKHKNRMKKSEQDSKPAGEESAGEENLSSCPVNLEGGLFDAGSEPLDCGDQQYDGSDGQCEGPYVPHCLEY